MADEAEGRVVPTVPYSVLVVEDDWEQAKALCRLLGQEPPIYRVTLAATAADAREALDREHPDSMLLDLRLPNGIGVALVKTFRLRYPHLPIVVYTAGDFDTEELIIVGRADQVLRKAVNDVDDIKHELVCAIAKHKAEQMALPVETHLDAIQQINGKSATP